MNQDQKELNNTGNINISKQNNSIMNQSQKYLKSLNSPKSPKLNSLNPI